MKIKSLLIIAILAVAVFCFSTPVKVSAADCMSQLSLLSTSDQITCLTQKIAELTSQIQAILIQKIAELTSQIQAIQAQQGITASWCHTFNIYTYIGTTNATTNGDVSWLQIALTKEGFNVTGDDNGTFGESTVAAVVGFQAKYGIQQTGAVGPITRAKLNALYGCTVSCTPNWQTGSWSTCSNSQQTRSVTDSNNCGGTTNKPVTSQGCTISCTPNWQTGSWSTCANGYQTRSVSDLNNCGLTTNNPVTTQGCTIICTPNWQPGSWSTCSNSQQTRSVTDSNNCGVTTNKPTTTQGCTISCTPNWQTSSWSTCANGYQTRSVTDSNNCGVTTNNQVTTQGCYTICTPNWQTGLWSTCSNSQQTRSVTDSNDCGVTTNKPVTSQGCTISCTPNWTCTGFANSQCVNYVQTQTCTDSNNCGVTVNQPDTIKSCTPTTAYYNLYLFDATFTTCQPPALFYGLYRYQGLHTFNNQQDCINASMSNPVSCTPDWRVSSWSTCSNSQQTRSVTDLNNCGVTTNKPVTSQGCIISCTPNWHTGSWSTCANGQQTRSVTDLNNCGVTTNTVTGQSCITVTSPNGGETWARGEQHNIMWTSSEAAVNDFFSITLVNDDSVPAYKQILVSNYKPGSALYAWVNPPSQAGSYFYPWTVPDYLSGSNFYFLIQDVSPTPAGPVSGQGGHFSITIQCSPNWQTGPWSSCDANNVQTRTVTDSNNCEITTNKPATYGECAVPPNVHNVSMGNSLQYSFVQGSTYNISWLSEGLADAGITNLRITLKPGSMLGCTGGEQTIANVLATSNSYSWKIPYSSPVPGLVGVCSYQIKIWDPVHQYSSWNGLSGTFNIVAPTAPLGLNLSQISLASISSAINAIAKEIQAMLGR